MSNTDGKSFWESPHWNFAYLSAVSRLDMLVWDFDFDSQVGEKNYTELPKPSKLVIIIDGFLSEKANLVQSEIRELMELRERLADKLIVTYEKGRQHSHELWSNASKHTIAKYVEFGNDEIRNQARLLMNSDWSLSEKSWFLEAFCKTWQRELVEAVREHLEQE